jgi:pilus assembly protein CpaE
MSKIIFLVDDDDMLRKMTEILLSKKGFEVIAIENGAKALQQLKSLIPDVILLDVMMPEMDGFSVCREIRANPATAAIPIIMLTALDNVENKVKGFEAGADDYQSKPFEIDDLVTHINTMTDRTDRSTPKIKPVVIPAVRESARTIAVFSLRGGSGVSTVSANLAAGLSQLWERKVALVDMVPVAGQTALFLNQPLRSTWTDVCALNKIEEEAVLNAMLTHETKVRTLASPRRPEESEMVTPDKVRKTLEVLRAAFPYVVLDMPHDLSERSLAALKQSDVILVITQPEIASLRAANMALEIFETLKYKEHKKIHIILNRTFPHGALPDKDIETMLKSKIDLQLPYASDEFVNALNAGNPPVLSNPTGQVGAIFEGLAMALSKETHRNNRPEQPSIAWQRVDGHIRGNKSN